MKTFLAKIIFIVLLLSASIPAVADVYVEGYYRKDGTYVRPHIRSNPDGVKWNNYGPSQRSSELMNPWSRNYDQDGTPNYLDFDSDNDGWMDDYDSNPYGD